MVGRKLGFAGRLLPVAINVLVHFHVQHTLGQNLTCSSDDVDAYIQCVKDNPCLCSNCDPDPLDGTPQIVVESPPENCQDINRLFCPLIRCCSACEDQARAWYGCTFQDFSLDTLGVDCPNSCSGFSYLDVEGDCEPTPAPSQSPTPCESEADDVDSCSSNNAQCDTSCAVSRSHLKAKNKNSDAGTCKQHNDIVCPLVDCCSDCSKQIKTLSQCLQEELQLSGDDGTQCTLSCDAANEPPTSAPSISTSPVPQPSGSAAPPQTSKPISRSTSTSTGFYRGTSAAVSVSSLGLSMLLSLFSFEM